MLSRHDATIKCAIAYFIVAIPIWDFDLYSRSSTFDSIVTGRTDAIFLVMLAHTRTRITATEIKPMAKPVHKPTAPKRNPKHKNNPSASPMG